MSDRGASLGDGYEPALSPGGVACFQRHVTGGDATRFVVVVGAREQPPVDALITWPPFFSEDGALAGYVSAVGREIRWEVVSVEGGAAAGG